MNVPDLRNVDFDAYRQQAVELRQQAMNDAIDHAAAWLRSLLGSRPRRADAVTARAASTTAQFAA
jgi:hypothetical protein